MRLFTADAVRTHRGVLGDALLVDGSRIAAVGLAEDLGRPEVPEDRFPGATIVPGLRDAHLHPVGHAASLTRPSLKAAADFAAVADILHDASERLPAEASLVALRLDDESLAEGRLPDRRFLDSVAADRPVLVLRYCGHVGVANTVALEAAGVAHDTTDPPGGSIDRDKSGTPTGVLRETALEPVVRALQDRAAPLTADDLVRGVFGLASVGLTSVGAMADARSGPWTGGGSEIDSILSAASRLPLDMAVFVIASTPAELDAAAERLATSGGRVRFAGVKMFSDGSLGGHTAAMHAGFADRPDMVGIDRLDIPWALEMARASLRLEGRVAIHAIGDRANGKSLDVMERLVDEGADPSLLRIEHASVLTPQDIERFGRLGVTASVQPAFIASETGWLEKRLGPERLTLTYPFRSLADAGVPLAGGSDCPVEPPHPLWGMATARDRCGLVPEQGLRPDEALALFTEGSGRAIGDEGTLDPGSAATFTILDADPITVGPDELRSTDVLAVFLDGSRVPVPPGTVAWAQE